MLILVLHEILALNFNSRQTCIYITAEFLLYCICLRNLRLIVSQRLTNFFFFSILSCPLSFFSFNLSFSVYISSRSLLLGLSLLSLSLSLCHSHFYLSFCPSIRCTRCLLMPQGTERFVTCVRQNISGSRPATGSARWSNTKQRRNSMVHVNTEKENN